jgi:hypothetical protein
MGLAMLGAMLMAHQITPIAHPTAEAAPWRDRRPDIRGGWIELVFERESPQ